MNSHFRLNLLVSIAALCLLPGVSYAQTQLDSLKITYSQHTRVVVGGTYTNCHSEFVGSHPDPKGNGKDSDYIYKFDTGNVIADGRAGPTPSAWTGMAEDIPGERITFLGGKSSSSTPTWLFSGCDIFATHAAAWAGFEAWVHFTKVPNKKPVALFTHSEGDELLTIDFDASESDDEDGEVVSYAWDFDGDGSVDSNTGPFVSHKYEKRGTYEVRLVVTDDDGDDSAPFKSTLLVEGPDLTISVSAKQHSALNAKLAEKENEFQVGDTLRLSVLVENSGDYPLSGISLANGISDIEVISNRDNTLLLASEVKSSIDRLEPGESDTLIYHYAAVLVQEGVRISIKSIKGEIAGPVADGETHTLDIATCSIGKVTGADDSQGCIELTILPAPVVVNSTGDDPLQPGLTEEDGCSTGGSIVRDGESEPECTLRAAMQHVASRTDELPINIEFDIPGVVTTHTIDLDGPSLPALRLPVSILGSSQPNGRVEVNGANLQGGATSAAFELGGSDFAARVEGLAFYGFPGTVISLGGDGSVVEGCYFGSDWAQSYTSTDVDIIDSMRNNGVAILVTGSNIRIGGYEQEGNLIVGSTYGIFVEGSDDVQILGNRIGVLESPHSENGVEVSASDDVTIGLSDAGNTISFNLGHGIRAGAGSTGLRVEGNELERNRKDAVNIDLGGAGGNASRIGGEEPGQGNTITRSVGAGIRVSGGGVRDPGAEASLAILGNTLGANEDGGVVAEGASNVDIGGETGEPGTGAGNDIEDGVRLAPGAGVRVMGNRIALLDPVTGVSLHAGAVQVEGTANVVGGESPAHGNVIYGVPSPTSSDDPDDNQFLGFGVDDSGSGTLIWNNFIGTDGSSAMGLLHGVVLRGVDARVHENLISGNGGSGVSVRSPAQIWGNRIGTGATGNTALPNEGAGIEVFAAATIGGEKDGEACESPCNVISGNGDDGILIRADAAGTKVQGNYIGLGADGLSVVGNGGSGIVALADNVVVGGPNDIELFNCKGACNIIAGNGADGIRNFSEESYNTLSSGMASDTKSAGEGGSSGMVVQGNFIGTGLDIPGSGNAGHGVSLGALGASNEVGGAVTGQGNLISGNGGSGVLVMASTKSAFFKGTQWVGGHGNAVRGNRIVNNARPAIDLYPNYILPGGDGWSALSAEDLSYGPNRMINWPYIIESNQGFSFNDILVYWRGPAGAGRVSLYVDLYTSASCNGSYGNAENFFVTRTAEFDAASGDTVRFQVPYIPSQPYYTATVTDSEGNTSELGNCRLAGVRPAKALTNLGPDVLTQVNGILLRLHEAEAPDGSKTAQAVEAMVLASAHDPGQDRFDAYAAATPAGGQLVPASVVSDDVWEVLEMGPVQNTRYQVCLPAPQGGGEHVVLGRGPTTSGHWRAYNTYAHQAEGNSYLCTDAVSATAFALGSGEAPALGVPVLTSPSAGDAGVDGGSPFRWQPVPGAASYELELALDPAFSTLLMREQNLTSTELMPTVLARSATHLWRVRAVADGQPGPWSTPGTFRTSLTMVGLVGEGEQLPSEYSLSQNFPNPFNPSTTIAFTLPEAGQVELRIIDILGRRVATLLSGRLGAGAHQIQYDASRLSSGVYIYQLIAGRTVMSKKMTLIK